MRELFGMVICKSVCGRDGRVKRLTGITEDVFRKNLKRKANITIHFYTYLKITILQFTDGGMRQLYKVG